MDILNIINSFSKKKILSRVVLSNIAILFIVEAKNLHFVIAKRIIRKNTLLDLENLASVYVQLHLVRYLSLIFLHCYIVHNFNHKVKSFCDLRYSNKLI